MEEQEVAEVLTVQAERGRSHMKLGFIQWVHWKTSFRRFSLFRTKNQMESYW